MPTERKIDQMFQHLQRTICRCLVVQLERSSTTGKLHFQGFIGFSNSLRMSAIKRLFAGAHIERAISPEDACRYCSKDDTAVRPFKRISMGILPTGRGHRSDLEDMSAVIKTGSKTSRAIFEEFPSAYIRYFKGIEKARNFYLPIKRQRPIIIVLWGDSGTGKTSSVYNHYGYSEVYRFAPNNGTGNLWMDDYDHLQHPIVLFDDFYGWIKYGTFLQMIDKYPLRCQTKGSQIFFNPRVIIITSNTHPEDWYKNVHYKTPIKRRISHIQHFTENAILNFPNRVNFLEIEAVTKQKWIDEAINELTWPIDSQTLM